MEAALRKQLKSINKYNKIERNNYNLKTELGHLLRMVHTWICITIMTEHPEGRRKEDRSKTTVRKSIKSSYSCDGIIGHQQEQQPGTEACGGSVSRPRYYFVILLFYFEYALQQSFLKDIYFFVELPFVDKRKKLLILSKYLRKWLISFHILIKRNFMDIFTKKFVCISS